MPLFQEQVMRLAVVAADYTPGEADQLRRDMAAWKKTGRIERHRERLISRMQAKGISPEFAEAVFNQIRGFGAYGFPESHAASFALIAYATSWLKCHYPAEFTCGILNALPMGFYSAATLVEDARRHGVAVRPVDVQRSEWDCTLERIAAERRAIERQEFAVRTGLRYVKGLRERDGRSIVEARGSGGSKGSKGSGGAFRSLQGFCTRTDANQKTRDALARAGAFESLGSNRRAALWELEGTPVVAGAGALPLEEQEPAHEFARLSEFETIGWDYRAMSLSTRGHPLEPLRDTLTAMRLPDARSVTAMRNGERVRYAGIVICRQRPGTASGVTFMTLEDETGFVNVVLWQRVFEQFNLIAKTEVFLGVTGKLQIEDGVVHVIADRLWVPELPEEGRPEAARSRDFH